MMGRGARFRLRQSAACGVLLSVLATTMVVSPASATGWKPQVTLSFNALSEPKAFVVNSAGDMFIADGGASNVVELPHTLGPQVTLGFSGLIKPTGLAVGTDGSVYVADEIGNDVLKLPPSGPQVTLPFTGLSGPQGVALGPNGSVYVVDGGNNRVLKLQGNAQSTVSMFPMNAPTAIAVDSAGNVYVADTGFNRILVAPATGVPGKMPFLDLLHPAGIAVDRSGDVIVADTDHDRVVLLPPHGNQVTLPFANTVTKPVAIAADAIGNVYATDNHSNAFRLSLSFDPAERFAEAAYADFLGRPPTNTELENVASGIESSQLTRSMVVGQLSNSVEWISALVQKLYVDTLGRPGDLLGVGYWTQQILNGRSVASVAASFYASNEYYAGIGGGTPNSWITDLYHKLLLRNPDAGGLAYWTGQIAATSRTSVAMRFFNSGESCHARVRALYQALLGRFPDTAGADYWATIVAVKGDLALAANLAASTEYYNRSQIRFS